MRGVAYVWIVRLAPHLYIPSKHATAALIWCPPQFLLDGALRIASHSLLPLSWGAPRKAII